MNNAARQAGVLPGNASRKSQRFGLKQLLLVVACLAIGLAILTQVGVRSATFRVTQNNLSITEEGKVRGELFCLYSGPGSGNDGRTFRFEIQAANSHKLLDLQRGHTSVVRFRHQPLWPLKKQDPFQRYIERALDIHRSAIRGYVMKELSTDVVINEL